MRSGRWSLRASARAVLLVLVTPGLLGVAVQPASAAPLSWRAAIAALAGTTPGTPSAGLVLRARASLDADDPSKAVVRTVQAAAEAATTGYLGDGTRFVSAKDLGLGYARQAAAAAVLSGALEHGRGHEASRTDALVAVTSAAIRSARVSYGDAVRIVGSPEGTATGLDPIAPDAVSDPAALAAQVRERCEPGDRGTGRRLVAQAREHLNRMDRALRDGRPTVAVLEGAVASAVSYAALRSVGVDPLRNGAKAADADRDGLPDSLELVLGAHPLKTDSDGDGLKDGDEAARFTGVLRLDVVDTDRDGVPDGRDDEDGDGLTNADEVATGSDPLEPDTDGDTLADGEERRAATKATVKDTDGDGLLDGPEVRAGLNPLAEDSDGDGVLDGDEVVDQPVRGPDGVTVTVQAAGDVASAVTVTRVSTGSIETEQAPGRVGPAYDISLSRGPPPARAVISLPFTAAELPAGTNPANLRVFVFDEARRTWVPAGEDQTVDVAAGRVSVTVPHFSVYALFDIVNWRQQWTSVAADCTPGDDPVPVDVALVLDSSGSMADNDPQGLRRTAAKSFIDALVAGDQAGVVDFDSSARVLQALTADKAALKAAVDAIDDSGGTSIAAGVSAGLGILPGASDARASALILLTDGQGTWDDALLTAAASKKTAIFTIGLGAAADTVLLQRIATTTGGRYFGVSDATQLPQVFRSLAGCVKDPTPGGVAPADCQSADTDNDGLRDCTEAGGYALGTGTVVTTDPAKEDTDGDGVPDGQEAGVPADAPATGSVQAYAAVANPTIADTDGDGLDDGNEVDLGSNAWSSDTDNDALPDGDELDEGTDLQIADTDGDSFSDGYEVQHQDDQGLDPVAFDEVLSKWDYIRYFVQGALCGDITWSWIGCGENDQLPRLIGNVVGSFIPLVDIRDVLAGLIKADVVAVVISLVGLIPVIGDAGGVVGKIGKFVSRFPAKLLDVARWVARTDAFTDTVKIAVLRVVLSGFGTLRASGVADADIIRLARGATRIPDLVDALASPLRRVGGAVGGSLGWVGRSGGFKAWQVAERRVADLYRTVDPNLRTNVPFRQTVNGRARVVRNHDIVLTDGTRVEVKSGFVARFNRTSDTCRQARIDADAIASGAIPAAVWHFVPSNSGGRWGLGPSAEVLRCLTEFGIPFVIHTPG